ncbi:hypothetical protein Bhyg_12052 [Pseudolycoriella hygida]|uniref:Uncharacterized protein n=1 Tax=Pseudolycoriella hygida TaxID=35572 RepID=A0A9Q0MWM7_9DIPT|nr:hypothetical protein Bhyg_12052 [Pseudolycoriella hygida]
MITCTSYTLRWHPKYKHRRGEYVNVWEYRKALQKWIKFAQNKSFPTEINDCLNGDELPTKSRWVFENKGIDSFWRKSRIFWKVITTVVQTVRKCPLHLVKMEGTLAVHHRKIQARKGERLSINDVVEGRCSELVATCLI